MQAVNYAPISNVVPAQYPTSFQRPLSRIGSQVPILTKPIEINVPPRMPSMPGTENSLSDRNKLLLQMIMHQLLQFIGSKATQTAVPPSAPQFDPYQYSLSSQQPSTTQGIDPSALFHYLLTMNANKDNSNQNLIPLINMLHLNNLGNDPSSLLNMILHHLLIQSNQKASSPDIFDAYMKKLMKINILKKVNSALEGPKFEPFPGNTSLLPEFQEILKHLGLNTESQQNSLSYPVFLMNPPNLHIISSSVPVNQPSMSPSLSISTYSAVQQPLGTTFSTNSDSSSIQNSMPSPPNGNNFASVNPGISNVGFSISSNSYPSADLTAQMISPPSGSGISNTNSQIISPFQNIPASVTASGSTASNQLSENSPFVTIPSVVQFDNNLPTGGSVVPITYLNQLNFNDPQIPTFSDINGVLTSLSPDNIQIHNHFFIGSNNESNTNVGQQNAPIIPSPSQSNFTASQSNQINPSPTPTVVQPTSLLSVNNTSPNPTVSSIMSPNGGMNGSIRQNADPDLVDSLYKLTNVVKKFGELKNKKPSKQINVFSPTPYYPWMTPSYSKQSYKLY